MRLVIYAVVLVIAAMAAGEGLIAAQETAERIEAAQTVALDMEGE